MHVRTLGIRSEGSRNLFFNLKLQNLKSLTSPAAAKFRSPPITSSDLVGDSESLIFTPRCCGALETLHQAFHSPVSWLNMTFVPVLSHSFKVHYTGLNSCRHDYMPRFADKFNKTPKKRGHRRDRPHRKSLERDLTRGYPVIIPYVSPTG
jgi:hypothetical protein